MKELDRKRTNQSRNVKNSLKKSGKIVWEGR